MPFSFSSISTSKSISLITGSQHVSILLYILLASTCISFYIAFAPENPISYLLHQSIKTIKEGEVIMNQMYMNYLSDLKPSAPSGGFWTSSGSDMKEEEYTSIVIPPYFTEDVMEEVYDEDLPYSIYKEKVEDFFGCDHLDTRAYSLYSRITLEKGLGWRYLLKKSWKELIFSFLSLLLPLVCALCFQ